jgi:hypothetical protein
MFPILPTPWVTPVVGNDQCLLLLNVYHASDILSYVGDRHLKVVREYEEGNELVLNILHANSI